LAFPIVLGEGLAQVVAFSGQLPALTYLTDHHYPWAGMSGPVLELYLQFPTTVDAVDFFTNSSNNYAATIPYRNQGLDAIYGFIDPSASTVLSPPPSPPSYGAGGPGYMNMYFEITNATSWGYYAVNGMTSVLAYGGTLEFVGPCAFPTYVSGGWGSLPFGTTSNPVWCGMLKFPTLAMAKTWALSPEYAQMIPYRNDGTSAIFAAYESIFPFTATNSSYDNVIVSATVINQTASDQYDNAAFPIIIGAGGSVVSFSGQLSYMTYLTEVYYPWTATTTGNVLELVLRFPQGTAYNLFTNSSDYLATTQYRDAGIDGVYGFVYGA